MDVTSGGATSSSLGCTVSCDIEADRICSVGWARYVSAGDLAVLWTKNIPITNL
jgi:hypothetical protein